MYSNNDGTDRDSDSFFDIIKSNSLTKVENAIAYLGLVKKTFSHEDLLYSEFLDILDDFKSISPSSIDVLIQRISELFDDIPELILGLNDFLPRGYKIIVDKGALAMREPPGSLKHIEVRVPNSEESPSASRLAFEYHSACLSDHNSSGLSDKSSFTGARASNVIRNLSDSKSHNEREMKSQILESIPGPSGLCCCSVKNDCATETYKNQVYSPQGLNLPSCFDPSSESSLPKHHEVPVQSVTHFSEPRDGSFSSLNNSLRNEAAQSVPLVPSADSSFSHDRTPLKERRKNVGTCMRNDNSCYDDLPDCADIIGNCSEPLCIPVLNDIFCSDCEAVDQEPITVFLSKVNAKDFSASCEYIESSEDRAKVEETFNIRGKEFGDVKDDVILQASITELAAKRELKIGFPRDSSGIKNTIKNQLEGVITREARDSLKSNQESIVLAVPLEQSSGDSSVQNGAGVEQTLGSSGSILPQSGNKNLRLTQEAVVTKTMFRDFQNDLHASEAVILEAIQKTDDNRIEQNAVRIRGEFSRAECSVRPGNTAQEQIYSMEDSDFDEAWHPENYKDLLSMVSRAMKDEVPSPNFCSNHVKASKGTLKYRELSGDDSSLSRTSQPGEQLFSSPRKVKFRNMARERNSPVEHPEYVRRFVMPVNPLEGTSTSSFCLSETSFTHHNRERVKGRINRAELHDQQLSSLSGINNGRDSSYSVNAVSSQRSLLEGLYSISHLTSSSNQRLHKGKRQEIVNFPKGIASASLHNVLLSAVNHDDILQSFGCGEDKSDSEDDENSREAQCKQEAMDEFLEDEYTVKPMRKRIRKNEHDLINRAVQKIRTVGSTPTVCLSEKEKLEQERLFGKNSTHKKERASLLQNSCSRRSIYERSAEANEEGHEADDESTSRNSRFSANSSILNNSVVSDPQTSSSNPEERHGSEQPSMVTIQESRSRKNVESAPYREVCEVRNSNENNWRNEQHSGLFSIPSETLRRLHGERKRRKSKRILDDSSSSEEEAERRKNVRRFSFSIEKKSRCLINDDKPQRKMRKRKIAEVQGNEEDLIRLNVPNRPIKRNDVDCIPTHSKSRSTHERKSQGSKISKLEHFDLSMERDRIPMRDVFAFLNQIKDKFDGKLHILRNIGKLFMAYKESSAKDALDLEDALCECVKKALDVDPDLLPDFDLLFPGLLDSYRRTSQKPEHQARNERVLKPRRPPSEIHTNSADNEQYLPESVPTCFDLYTNPDETVDEQSSGNINEGSGTVPDNNNSSEGTENSAGDRTEKNAADNSEKDTNSTENAGQSSNNCSSGNSENNNSQQAEKNASAGSVTPNSTDKSSQRSTEMSRSGSDKNSNVNSSGNGDKSNSPKNAGQDSVRDRNPTENGRSTADRTDRFDKEMSSGSSNKTDKISSQTADSTSANFSHANDENDAQASRQNSNSSEGSRNVSNQQDKQDDKPVEANQGSTEGSSQRSSESINDDSNRKNDSNSQRPNNCSSGIYDTNKSDNSSDQDVKQNSTERENQSAPETPNTNESRKSEYAERNSETPAIVSSSVNPEDIDDLPDIKNTSEPAQLGADHNRKEEQSRNEHEEKSSDDFSTRNTQASTTAQKGVEDGECNLPEEPGSSEDIPRCTSVNTKEDAVSGTSSISGDKSNEENSLGTGSNPSLSSSFATVKEGEKSSVDNNDSSKAVSDNSSVGDGPVQPENVADDVSKTTDGAEEEKLSSMESTTNDPKPNTFTVDPCVDNEEIKSSGTSVPREEHGSTIEKSDVEESGKNTESATGPIEEVADTSTQMDTNEKTDVIESEGNSSAQSLDKSIDMIESSSDNMETDPVSNASENAAASLVTTSERVDAEEANQPKTEQDDDNKVPKDDSSAIEDGSNSPTAPECENSASEQMNNIESSTVDTPKVNANVSCEGDVPSESYEEVEGMDVDSTTGNLTDSTSDNLESKTVQDPSTKESLSTTSSERELIQPEVSTNQESEDQKSERREDSEEAKRKEDSSTDAVGCESHTDKDIAETDDQNHPSERTEENAEDTPEEFRKESSEKNSREHSKGNSDNSRNASSPENNEDMPHGALGGASGEDPDEDPEEDPDDDTDEDADDSTDESPEENGDTTADEDGLDDNLVQDLFRQGLVNDTRDVRGLIAIIKGKKDYEEDYGEYDLLSDMEGSDSSAERVEVDVSFNAHMKKVVCSSVGEVMEETMEWRTSPKVNGNKRQKDKEEFIMVQKTVVRAKDPEERSKSTYEPNVLNESVIVPVSVDEKVIKEESAETTQAISLKNYDPEILEYATVEDIAFYEKARSVVKPHEYENFLRLCNMYNHSIIVPSDFLDAVTKILGPYPNVFNLFKKAYFHEEDITEVDIVAKPGSPVDSDCDADYTPVEVLGISYRTRPAASAMLYCSGRNNLCREVLNEEWISVPSSSSEDTVSVTAKKTTIEDYSCKMEDERFELDIILEVNKYAIERLQLLVSELDAMSQEDRLAFELDEDFGASSGVLMKRAIKRIYGETASTILAALRYSPHATARMVLERLMTKEKEWLEARRNMNEMFWQWREQNEKHVLRACDQQSNLIKATDTRWMKTKNLIRQIEIVYEERKMRSDENFSEEYGPHIVCYYPTEDDVTVDANNLILHYVKKQSNIQRTDKSKIKKFLKRHLNEWFSYKLEDLSENEDDTDPQYQLDTFKARGKQPCIPGESKTRIVYGGNILYSFLRIHHIICERLGNLKKKNRTLLNQYFMERENWGKLNTIYVEEGKNGPRSELLNANDINNGLLNLREEQRCPATFYYDTIREIKLFIDGQLENPSFEEGVRSKFPTDAYLVISIDKVLAAAVRQLHQLVSDELESAVLPLYNRFRLEDALHTFDRSLFRAEYEQEYRKTIVEEFPATNRFKFTIISDLNHVVTMEMLDTDHEPKKRKFLRRETVDYFLEDELLFGSLDFLKMHHAALLHRLELEEYDDNDDDEDYEEPKSRRSRKSRKKKPAARAKRNEVAVSDDKNSLNQKEDQSSGTSSSKRGSSRRRLRSSTDPRSEQINSEERSEGTCSVNPRSKDRKSENSGSEDNSEQRSSSRRRSEDRVSDQPHS